MALTYSFLIDTPAGVGDVAATVSKVAVGAGLAGPDTGFAGDGGVLTSGVLVQVGPTTPSPFNPVLEDFGFNPTVHITFRLANLQDAAPQQDDVVRIVAGLLEHHDGDAILHFQYDVVWLLRRNGKITVCDRDTIWTNRRLQLLGRPHERGNPAFSEE